MNIIYITSISLPWSAILVKISYWLFIPLQTCISACLLCCIEYLWLCNLSVPFMCIIFRKSLPQIIYEPILWVFTCQSSDLKDVFCFSANDHLPFLHFQNTFIMWTFILIFHLERNISNLSPSQWPERSVLQNYENLERIRQKSRWDMFIIYCHRCQSAQSHTQHWIFQRKQE